MILFLVYSYAAVSIITFCTYAWDKHRAKVSKWRVKEETLHILELLGGWPGALLAQRVFHHKWRKTAYMRLFWVIVTLHLVLWAVLIYFKFIR